MERRTYEKLAREIIRSSRVLSGVVVLALNLPQIHPGSINSEFPKGQAPAISKENELPKYPKLQAILPELTKLPPEAKRRQNWRV